MFDTDPNNYYGSNFNSNVNRPFGTNQEKNQELNYGSFLKVGEELYKVKRVIKKSQFKNTDDVLFYRDFINAETVKQRQEYYLFLDHIPSVEFEEIDADIA